MLENPNAVANVVANVDLSCFDQRWVLGAQIGKDTSSNFALSFEGLAVRTPDNRYVVPHLDDGVVKLIDVTCLTIAADPYVFRIPVAIEDVEPGHLLVRSDSPFSLLFVEENPKDGRIHGIDPRSDEAVEIVIPDKSLDVPTLLVRVMSLYDGFGGGLFGEGDDDGGTEGLGGMLPFLMAGGLGGGGFGATGGNNVLLALALSRSRKIDSRLALLMMASGTQTSSLTQVLLLSALSGRQGGGGVFGARRRKREEPPPSGRSKQPKAE